MSSRTAILLLLSLTTPAVAQVEQGAITGAVIDATGSAIPKAKVTATTATATAARSRSGS